jgi:AcrR family transcriptional regulator
VTNPTATVRTTPRQRRAQERVDVLLDAAADLIERGGLDAVTTTAVAAKAGTSVGGLYRYFADARAILRALATRNMERYWAGIAAEPPSGTGRDFLAAVMDRYVAFARAEPGFAALRFGQVLDGYSGDRTVSLQIAERLEAAYALSGGVVPSEDLRLDLEIAATMSSALMDLAFARDPHGDQQVIDRTIELALVLLTRHVQPG